MREAIKLAKETGCLPSEAASVLSVASSIDEAREDLLSVLRARRRLYEPKLAAIWREFAADASEMGVSECMELLQTIGVDLASPTVFCIAYELQSPSLGRINYDSFVNGWARLECTDIESMRQCASRLVQELRDADYFKRVYEYCFDLNCEDKRTVDIEVARACWEVLLLPRYPIIKNWLEFCKEGVSRDTWNMLLELCVYEQTDPELAHYDASNAWPLEIDDFVDYLRAS